MWYAAVTRLTESMNDREEGLVRTYIERMEDGDDDTVSHYRSHNQKLA